MLSIIVPVYNEQQFISHAIEEISSTRFPLEYEIIIVNDGSTDNTRKVLLTFNHRPHIRIIHCKKNLGKGNAVRKGLAIARGEIILIHDADLEYSPKDIPALLKPILRGTADVVFGSRFLQGKTRMSFTYRFGNWFLTHAFNVLFKTTFSDVLTCYKLFRKSAIDVSSLKECGFEIDPEIAAKLSIKKNRVIELSIHYRSRDRNEGKKNSIGVGIRSFIVMIKLRLSR